MRYFLAILIALAALGIAFFLMQGMRVAGWSHWIVWPIGIFIAISGGYISRSVAKMGRTQGDPE